MPMRALIGMSVLVVMVMIMVMPVPVVMMVMAATLGRRALVQARAVGLDARALGFALRDSLALGRDLGTKPVEPSRDAVVSLPRRKPVHRRGAGKVADETLGAVRIEVVQIGEQVGFGE